MSDETSLLAFLLDCESKARTNDLAEERENALDYYNGEPFGDEEEGRSQLVTRDVAEVVDYMTISILRTMVSGDRVVEFEHQDSAKAQEATEALSRQFMRGQQGYRIIHDWIKAGLLEKTGWAKTFPDRKVARAEYMVPAEVIPEDALEAEETQELDEFGAPLWRVVVLEEQPVRVIDLAVPNEEVLVLPDARDSDDLPYLAHATKKTVSQLRQMGFDVADDIADNGNPLSSLESARNPGRYDPIGQNEQYGPGREVWLLEEHCRFDLNGDGIVENLCIHRVGKTILNIEEIEESYLTDWCPFPMQHRLIGQSLADKTMDIQRVRSVVLRQTMDGFYFANNPRTFINDQSIGDSTIDDLLTVRAGGIVRWTGGIKPETVSAGADIGAGSALLEQFVGERESRTGITRLNQGLDADALNKTATGTALMQAQGQQIEEYLARNFAEAFARLMMKKYRLTKRYGQPFGVMIDGEYRQVDPSQWPDDMEVTVRVGLGSGRKEQRLAYRMELLGIQQTGMQAGLSLVDEDKLYNNLSGIVADANLGSIREYFNDPEMIRQQNGGEMPQRPDPAMAEAQAKAALEAEKIELEKQKAAANIQLQQAENEARIELMREEAAAKLDLEAAKAAHEAAANERRMDFEERMAERQAAFNERMAEKKAATDEKTMKKNRPGGDLSK